jgi:predicted  nucleic acid-binding Zn-ribbon protein
MLVETGVSIMTLTHFKDDERKANPRAAMVRVEIRDAQGYANQRRHDLRIGAQPAYVNPDPPEPNRVFIQPMTTQEIKALARERRAQRDMARAMKSNSGVAVVGIIGFGIEAQKMFEALGPEDQERALRAAVARVAADLKTTVTGLVLHLDESARHAHFSLCGYDVTGQPLSTWMGRGVLRELQTALHEELQAFMPHLERGQSRKARAEAGAAPHELVNRSVEELHIDLPFEIAEKRKELAALEETIRTNEARAEKARIKAETEGDRAAKAQKNLGTYQRRAAEARERAEGLEGQVRDLEGRLEAIQAAKVAAEGERDRAREEALAAEERAARAEARIRDVDQIIGDAAALAAEAAAAVITGSLYQNDQGKWKARKGAPSPERLKPLWAHLRPALERVARWWDGVRGRVEALPEPEQQAFFDEVPPERPDEGPGF